jgi:hypothetical protein
MIYVCGLGKGEIIGENGEIIRENGEIIGEKEEIIREKTGNSCCLVFLKQKSVLKKNNIHSKYINKN